MKGKITSFKAEKGFGFIKGEDKKNYFFHISNVSNPMDIEENYTVDFKAQEKDKGLVAIDITVNTPLANKSKDKILKIKDLRIRASEIKEYELNVNKKCIEQYKLQEYNSHSGYQHTNSIMTYDELNISYSIGIKQDCDDICWNAYSSNRYHSGYKSCRPDMGGHYYYESSTNTHYRAEKTKGVHLNIYRILIKTYTSGKKEINLNDEKEANKWLTYIDNELEKLI
ncbi:MAG: cold shock domain-containing protein [Campylobacterota bacterium]|nr:cold shock domain-containing protein [Campylobacterota bacterium]